MEQRRPALAAARRNALRFLAERQVPSVCGCRPAERGDQLAAGLVASKSEGGSAGVLAHFRYECGGIGKY